MSELSFLDLDSELCAELPTRNMMRRRRRRHVRHVKHAYGYFPGANAGAHASYGSAANSNATYQINFNPQIVINNGTLTNAGINLDSHNLNTNANTQTGVPINFGIA